MITDKITLITAVKAAQSGDNKAIETLFKEFNQQIFYSVLLTVKNEEIAKDITQETFITVIKKINDLENPEAFPGWVKKVAHSKCSDYYKKKEVIHEIAASPDSEDDFDVFGAIEEDDSEFIPDKAMDKDDLKKIILDILNSLPDEQRAAIFMRYYEEMSVKEIAEIQGVSEGTVMSRLNYGRKAIAKAVEEYEEENDIKLHAIPIIPFFGWLFKGGTEGAKPGIFGSIATEVSRATGVTLSISTGAAATTGATGTAVVGGAVTATGVAAKIASIPLVVKIAVPVVLAATIATPTVIKHSKKEPATTTVPTTVVETTDVFSETTTTTEITSEVVSEGTENFVSETGGVAVVVTNVGGNQFQSTTGEENMSLNAIEITTKVAEIQSQNVTVVTTKKDIAETTQKVVPETTKKVVVETTKKTVAETTEKVVVTEDEGYDEDIYEIYDGPDEFEEETSGYEEEDTPELEMDGTTSPR